MSTEEQNILLCTKNRAEYFTMYEEQSYPMLNQKKRISGLTG
jgi:hypothetical protein